MPLFVVNEKIESLDIDAIVLPFYDEIINYYKTNYYNSKSLYEIYNTVNGIEKAEKISKLKIKLKSKLKQIYRINKKLDKKIHYLDYKIPIIEQNISGTNVDFVDYSNFCYFFSKPIKTENVRYDNSFLEKEKIKKVIY